MTAITASVWRVPNGLTQIEAYVTEIETDVPLTLDDFERDQWLIKIERAEFEQETKLDELRPDNNVVLTEPGRYRILRRHIGVHHYFRNLDLEREGSTERLQWEDAVSSWYDNIYLPVVEAIHKYGLLEDFPKRTEADLYLWIAYHREQLAKRFDLAPLSPDVAVSTFAESHSANPLMQAVQSLKIGLHRAFGDDERPLGMSDEVFDEARARHVAGERTIAEAEEECEEADQQAYEASLLEKMAAVSAVEVNPDLAGDSVQNVHDSTPAEFAENAA